MIDVLVTTAWLSLIIAARYLIVAGAMHAWLWRGKGAGTRLNAVAPSRQLIRHEIVHSLISTPIYALPAAIVLEAFKAGGTAIYLDPAQHGLWWLPVSFLVLLIVQDTHYYWTHRLMHDRRLFGWAHAAHHRSRDPSPFASFSFDPAEAALTAWVIPALLFVMPVHLGVLVALLVFMTVTAVMNHCGWELWPQSWVRGRIGRWLITATHHSRHHTHMRTNFGLYFRVWDRLCGTDAMPEVRSQAGSTTTAVP